VDTRPTPKRVLYAHPPDQPTQFYINRWSPSPLPRFPTPIAAKAGPMQTHQRLGADDCENWKDRREPTIELDEEPAIVVRKPGPAPHLTLQDDQLMSEHRILRLKPDRRHSLRFPVAVTNCAAVVGIRSNWPRQKPPAHAPHPVRSPRSMARPSLRPIIRSAQFPIARAAPPMYPFPRFPPLEAFGRRPPLHAPPLVSGRHPKPFTLAEVDSRQRLSPLCDRKQTSRSANGRSARGQMRALRQSLPAFRDLEGRLPLLPPVERRPSPHVLAETPPKRGSLDGGEYG
jgi:hypothetical protein